MKKVKIYYVIFLFVISFLWHFIYTWCPTFITSLFFPVNESIWEHMKIIYGTIVFGSIMEKYLLKKYNVIYHNFNIEIFVKSFLGVILYLSIYIPLYQLFGENIIVSILLMLIIYIIMEIIGTKILKYEELYIEYLPIVLIILGYILFFILTYYPPHTFLFFDQVSFIYGK